jgi:PAS domain S-box-containing protein
LPSPRRVGMLAPLGDAIAEISMDKPSLNTKDEIGLSSDAGTSPFGERTTAFTAATRTRFVRLLALVITVAALAIIAGAALITFELRVNALTAGEREVRDLASMMAPEIDLSVQAIERVQKGLIDRVNLIEIKSAPEYETRLSGYDAHLMLKDFIAGLPHVESITFVSANGKVFNTSRAWPSNPIDVSDRDYFKDLMADPRREFAWSDPVRNRTTGTWSMYLARKVWGPNHELLGAVTAGLELRSFETRFAAFAPDAGISVALIRNDGTLVAQFPHFEDAMGQRDPSSQQFEPVVADPDPARITAAQPIKLYPAVIAVSIAASTVLAQWRSETLYLAAGAFFVLVLIGGIWIVTARRFGSHATVANAQSDQLNAETVRQNTDAVVAEREEAQQQLNRKKHELDAAVENLPQGLVMFDNEARLVVCNGRYIEMYGLTSEIAAPARELREIIAYRIEKGTLTANASQLAGIVQETVRAGKPWRSVTELPDGRSIDIMTTPLSNGGWVATHEDITERRRAERQLLRTEMFLATVIESFPTAITIKDARSLKYLLTNRAGEKYFGLPRSEIIGKTAYELFPQVSADLLESHDQQLLESGKEIFVGEHAIDTPAGEHLLVTVRRLSIKDQNGDPQYLLSLIDDVTKRQQIESLNPAPQQNRSEQSEELVA